MYGNFNPSTAAWPYTPEHIREGENGWAVVNNTDPVNPHRATEANLTFEQARTEASKFNIAHHKL